MALPDTDSRYTIDLHWCGYPEQRHCVWFCGNWVGSASSREGAERLARVHNAKRIGIL